MRFEGPHTGVAKDAERILRTLPMWFGIEEALQEYVQDTERLPTFVARDGQAIVGFLTVREHFPTAWEVHCLAVEAQTRNHGVGRSLHAHVESWLARKGVRYLQVKTISASSPSKEYAQTRAFYLAIGYQPLEEFPLLWAPRLPVLQLVKALPSLAPESSSPDRTPEPQ
jgi:GNAT superfamily N-acetyltransferase